MTCFSFTTNFKKLMTVDENEDKSLWSLNGIRVLAIALVTIGHSYSSSLMTPAHNLLFFMDIFKAPFIAIIVNGTFAVDTFFFLSGFLTFYLLTLKLYPNQGKGNYLLLYLHRYLRLLPILFSVMIFGMFIYPLIGNGANWVTTTNYIIKNCSKYWWTNFLYIDNFFPWTDTDACMGWVWYLANDMQFFLISPFLILVYCKSRKIGYSLISFLIFTTCAITFTLSMVYKIPATIQIGGEGNGQNLVYSRPWCWFSTYGLGGILGLIYFEHKTISKHKIVSFASVLLDTLKDSALMSWSFAVIGTGILCLVVFITPSRLFTGEISWS